MSTLLIAVGTACFAFWGAMRADLLVWLGAILFLLSYFVGNQAASQQRRESRAEDLVRWMRETQEFRRGVEPVWKMLDGAYWVGNNRRLVFSDFVREAGWPDYRGQTADELERLLEDCLPPRDTMMPPGVPVIKHVGKDGGNLIAPFESTKDILEIWSVALENGGSSGSSLRESLSYLRKNHEDSLRLVWWLTIAHAAHVEVATEPDYSFLHIVREAMKG